MVLRLAILLTFVLQPGLAVGWSCGDAEQQVGCDAEMGCGCCQESLCPCGGSETEPEPTPANLATPRIDLCFILQRLPHEVTEVAARPAPMVQSSDMGSGRSHNEHQAILCIWRT